MNDQQQKQIRTALYLRVSTEDQKEKYGIDLQKGAIEGIIKSKGQLDNGDPAMILAGEQYIYKDEGISGTLPLDERPAFLQMKEDIEDAPKDTKPFDIVAVYRIDRFARKLRILLDVIDYFEQHNIQFISANESIDTSTPFGKAMLGIIGVIAELEIETTKARTQAGRATARDKGVYMGASAPFGYKKNKNKQLEIFKEEARIVRKIFELFVVQKKKTQQIADYLTDKEILTPLPSSIFYGKRVGGNTKVNSPHFWRDSSVRDRIKDAVYTGKYFYNKHKESKRLNKSKWKLSPHRHESIIDKTIFELAQRRIQEDIALRNSMKATGNHTYLLSGLLKCHSCYDPYSDRYPINWTGTNKPLKKSGKKRRSYYYQCGGKNTEKYSNVCKAIPFPADAIEQFVTDFIKNLLDDPISIYNHINSLKSTKTRKKHLKEEEADLIKRTNRLPERIKAIKHQHECGYLTQEQFDAKMAKTKKLQIKLKKELSKVERRLGSIAISSLYLQAFEQFSESYESLLNDKITDRQELSDLIHLIVDKINVYSRKVTKKDKVAGRKTEGQLIPHQVRIDLRLPQEMLLRFAEQGKFEVKNAEL